MSCDNMYKVTLKIRGCRSCDICRIIEYVVHAAASSAAIESVKKVEFSDPREYHSLYLNWDAELITQPTQPIQISNTHIRSCVARLFTFP